MAASQASTQAMNGRAANAAVKVTPGMESTLVLGEIGVEVAVGAVGIGKKALNAGAETVTTAFTDPSSLGAVHSNSVPLETFLVRCETEQKFATERFENHLDFYKKYEKPAADAVIDLGETEMSWCLVYGLEKEEDRLLVPRECMDLCQRLWAVDVEVHCKTSVNDSEIYITVGLTYEMQVDEAQFISLSMRLNDAMGSVRFEFDKIHH